MLKPGRGKNSLFAAVVVCVNLWSLGSFAQSYPVKPIRLIVGYSPGGGTDITARAVAQKLTESLGQTVVVENRPGATGAIAAERVATSPADGYTLLMNSANDTILPALRRKLPFDVERGFSPVSLVVTAPMAIIVHPSVPAHNVKQLIALARSKPGKLSFGSAGTGNTTHLAGELFKFMAKVNIVHVPYKGSADSIIATATGQLDMSIASVAAATPMLNVGRLRALAVTSAKRVSSVPSLPTIAESGLPGFDYASWFGVAAPAGVPKDIIARLNTEIGKAVNTLEMKERFSKLGLEVETNTPEKFAALIHSEIEKNGKLVEFADLKKVD